MRQIKYDSAFERSAVKVKKGLNKRDRKLFDESLANIVGLLAEDSQNIPSAYKVHKLAGKNDIWEAHLLGRGSNVLLLFRKLQGVLHLIKVTDHAGLVYAELFEQLLMACYGLSVDDLLVDPDDDDYYYA